MSSEISDDVAVPPLLVRLLAWTSCLWYQFLLFVVIYLIFVVFEPVGSSLEAGGVSISNLIVAAELLVPVLFVVFFNKSMWFRKRCLLLVLPWILTFVTGGSSSTVAFIEACRQSNHSTQLEQ
jgi:hypothetical protein